MLQNKIQKLLYTLLILLFGCASLHYVSANNLKTLNVTKNYQKFIDFKKYPSLKTYYHNGIINFALSPNNKIDLIEKDDALVFWMKPGVYSADSILEIQIKDTSYTIPITADNIKDPLDFNIRGDMYDLSLQEKSLSCESAATADIIESYLGVEFHEDRVIEKLPVGSYYNALPEEHPGNITIWGNPELGFVGYIDSTDDINAKQKLMSGYGVYEAPISDVYQDLGFNTKIFNSSHHIASVTPSVHLRYMLEKLKSGSMVQLWGDWCTRLEYDDGILENKFQISTIPKSEFISAKNTCYNIDDPRELHWKYYDKHGNLTDHVGLDGEHAFILLGWKGDIGKPTYIRVWDTDTGYHLYPTHEWMRKWEAMDYRSIIVSKKDS